MLKIYILVMLFFTGSVISQNKVQLTDRQLDSLEYAVSLKKYPQNKLFIYAGGLFTDVEGSIVVNNGIIDVGTKLDFADNLKLNRNVNTFRVAAQYNLSRKSSLYSSFLILNQKSDITLLDSIKFGEYKFDANANFKFDLNFSYFSLNYCYNIVAKPQFQTGVTAGIRLFGIHTKGSGTATVNGESKAETSDNSAIAPGLLLGLNNSVYFLPNLLNRSSIEYFAVKIGSIKANLFEGKLGLEYYFHKNIGVGFLAFVNVLKVTSDSAEDFNGEVSYVFKGISLFMAVKF